MNANHGRHRRRARRGTRTCPGCGSRRREPCGRRRRPTWPAGHHRAPAPARSRPASGVAAGCCSRDHRSSGRRRRRRRRPGPRCGALVRRSCSTYTSPLPKAASASDRARSTAAGTSSRSCTTRIPRPPPPATALTIIAEPAGSPAKKCSAIAVSTGSEIPGTTGTPSRTARVRAADLVAEHREGVRRRADERQPHCPAPSGEHGVLGEEPVARVDGIAAVVASRRDHLVGVEIGGWTGAAQGDRIVGPAHVQRPAVVGRVHGNRRDAELGGGPSDPDRDLTSVGDQQLQRRPPRVDPAVTTTIA